MIMYLITLTFAVFIFSLILVIFQGHILRSDSTKRRLNHISQLQERNIFLDEDLKKPISERFFKPAFSSLWKRIRQYVPKENDGNVKDAKLKDILRRSGMKMSVNEYNVFRLLIMGGSAGIIFIIGLISGLPFRNIILLALTALYASYVILRFQITRKATQRRESMEIQLPEVLDTLSVSVEAGLGLEQAMIELANNFQGPLIDEIAITNREISLGKNRKDALILLGDRCEFEEMKTFVRAIVQAMGMGISIKNVLYTQAKFMRQSRKNKIEEKAHKISVKILLPMVLFIFPVIFIILLGPAAINLAEMLF